MPASYSIYLIWEAAGSATTLRHKSSFSLPTQVVNDKGRCRSHPILHRDAALSLRPAFADPRPP
jgi:hypothetical protein